MWSSALCPQDTAAFRQLVLRCFLSYPECGHLLSAQSPVAVCHFSGQPQLQTRCVQGLGGEEEGSFVLGAVPGALHASFYLEDSRVSAERFQRQGKSVLPGWWEVRVCESI